VQHSIKSANFGRTFLALMLVFAMFQANLTTKNNPPSKPDY